MCVLERGGRVPQKPPAFGELFRLAREQGWGLCEKSNKKLKWKRLVSTCRASLPGVEPRFLSSTERSHQGRSDGSVAQPGMRVGSCRATHRG